MCLVRWATVFYWACSQIMYTLKSHHTHNTPQQSSLSIIMYKLPQHVHWDFVFHAMVVPKDNIALICMEILLFTTQIPNAQWSTHGWPLFQINVNSTYRYNYKVIVSFQLQYSKNFGGEKPLANLVIYSNSPCFFAIFIISIALLMITQLPVSHQY